MVNEGDLIVFDQEFNYAAKQIRNYSDALNHRMDKYTSILREITASAIQDELIVARLEDLASAVEAVRTQVEGAGKTAGRLCTSYVQQIDEADRFLY